MKGRLIFAALAAALLTACPKSSKEPPKEPAQDAVKAVVVEKDGRYAVALQRGDTIEIYPLPETAYRMVDGKFELVSAGAKPGIIGGPCPCRLPECMPFCKLAWEVPPGTVDPTPRDTPTPTPGKDPGPPATTP